MLYFCASLNDGVAHNNGILHFGAFLYLHAGKEYGVLHSAGDITAVCNH